MAEVINPTRLAELEAQKATLAPILDGLRDDALTIISPELKAVYDHQIFVWDRRVHLINDEIAAMSVANEKHEALLADGYPDLPDVSVNADLWAEMQREKAARDAAGGIFHQEVATGGSIVMGKASDDPSG